MAYNGGLGAEPPAGSRAEPLVRGSEGQSPPEAESILVIRCPTEPANLAPFQYVDVHSRGHCPLSVLHGGGGSGGENACKAVLYSFQ